MSSMASASSVAALSLSKQRRLMLVEMVSKAKSRLSARALLKEKGFDPDDLDKYNNHGQTPMHYFCVHGNVTMVRYLMAQGADCRKLSAGGSSPLFCAARGSYLLIVQLLFHDGGAHEDIHRVTSDGYSPLGAALLSADDGNYDVFYWLILNGADVTINKNDFRPLYFRDWNNNGAWVEDYRLTVLAWAPDAVRIAVEKHDAAVQLLLTGMIESSKRTASPLAIFNGEPGILKLIADYGVDGSQQQLRTLRQLLDRLPAFIKDVPFIDEDEEDEDPMFPRDNDDVEEEEEEDEDLVVVPPPQDRFIDDDDVEEEEEEDENEDEF